MSVVYNPKKPPPPHPTIVIFLILITIGLIYIGITLNDIKNIEQGRGSATLQQSR